MALFASNIISSDSALGSAVIQRSLRIDQGTSDSDSGSNYSRTFDASGNRRTFTKSVWVKKCGTPGNIGDDQYAIFSAGGGGSGSSALNLYFYNNDRLQYGGGIGGSSSFQLYTTRLFRDHTAWYHIVAAVDTTESTSSDRVKLYVNGVQETDFETSTYPTQNYELYFNFNVIHRIGSNSLWSDLSRSYGNFNGYLAEFNFIDGTALTPSSFGFTDPQTGIWMPKRFEKSSIPNKKGTTFSSTWTASGNGFGGSNPITNAFDGDLSTSANNDGGGQILTWNTSTYNLRGELRIYCRSSSGVYDIYVNGNSGNTTKVGDTPSSNGWVDCGTFDHIKEIQFAGTTYNTGTGLGSAGVHILAIMVDGTLLRNDMPEYGTNGFYLDFSDNTSTTTLGIDKSPNGNDFTPEDVATSDSVKDTPTNAFAILNANVYADSNFEQGSLYFDAADTHKTAYSTIAVSSGKWYWEAKAIAGGTKFTYGVSDVKNITAGQVSGSNRLLAVSSGSPSDGSYSQGDAVSIYNSKLYKNGSVVTESYQTNPSIGDIIGVALDVDAGKVWFARNGTWINGSATASTTLNLANHDTTVTTGETYVPAISGESVDWQLNFGQDDSFSGTSTSQGNEDENGLGSFYYAVPSGFRALCTKNLPPNVPSIVRPQKHFECVTFTGNGSTGQSITSLEFQPDFIWFKNRSAGNNHASMNSVIGRSKGLYPDSNSGDFNSSAGRDLVSFDPSGFTVGEPEQASSTNNNGSNIVAWCWKAGGSSNTFNIDGKGYASASAAGLDDGSINPTGASVNTESGFSILTYTGTGSNATIGHGLGKAPKLIWVKLRGSQDWFVNNGMILNDLGKYYKLNSSSSSNASDTNVFPNTAPTSTVFSVGTDNAVNGNGDNYVAYIWSEIPGFSQFGYWTGNGNTNGPYIHTGFTPKLIIYRKESDTNWHMLDTQRDSLNPNTAGLDPNLSNAEADDSNLAIDFLSSGFKLRTSHSTANGSGTKYFYYTWAGQSVLTPFATVANAR